MHFPLECAQPGNSKQEQPAASRQLARGWRGWHGPGLTCQQPLSAGFREKGNPHQKHGDLESSSMLFALCPQLQIGNAASPRGRESVQCDPVTGDRAGSGDAKVGTWRELCQGHRVGDGTTEGQISLGKDVGRNRIQGPIHAGAGWEKSQNPEWFGLGGT